MSFRSSNRGRTAGWMRLSLCTLILAGLGLVTSVSAAEVTSRVAGKSLIATSPEEPASYVAYGEFLLANGDAHGATEVLEVGRKKAVPSAELLVMLGQAYEEQDMIARAESVTREALVVDPASVPALVQMGEIYFQLGWPKSGMESFRAAHLVAPGETLPKVRVIGGLVDQGKLAEAEDTCLKFISSDTESVDLWLALGQVFEKQDKLREAFTTYGQVLTLDPDEAEAYARQGRLFCRFGQYDAGRTACRKALEIDEENVLAHAYMGVACSNLGDGENARIHAEIAEAGGLNMRSVWNKLNQ